ncbi:MAG: exo-alpha-sialidase [Acidobacteriota bacterium]|nr:exo-alpha-sialidase [Acidobacteriota bacterium]
MIVTLGIFAGLLMRDVRSQGEANSRPAENPGVVKSEFVYEQAPFPSCHASTIAETKNGLVAAWFGGTDEGNKDVGIWFSRNTGGSWSQPSEVANGKQENGERYPTWNPVLFQPKEGPLLLFYKVGPRPSNWWGMLITSADEGKTWTKPRRLPAGILGPIKNKPVQMADGSLLCPSSSEDKGWRVHLETTRDFGQTWSRTEALNDGQEFAAIQPSILTYPSGKMQLLCRSRQGRITEVWSEDGGKSWGRMSATSLPNPSSGTDAVMLKDGRALLVYNHTAKGRSPLNVAVSSDGKTWQPALALENQPGEYSYPAVIQSADGLVHVTYTWKRQRIKHVVLDPRQISARALP